MNYYQLPNKTKHKYIIESLEIDKDLDFIYFYCKNIKTNVTATFCKPIKDTYQPLIQFINFIKEQQLNINIDLDNLSKYIWDCHYDLDNVLVAHFIIEDEIYNTKHYLYDFWTTKEDNPYDED